jgi:hypothetical protein
MNPTRNGLPRMSHWPPWPSNPVVDQLFPRPGQGRKFTLPGERLPLSANRQIAPLYGRHCDQQLT